MLNRACSPLQGTACAVQPDTKRRGNNERKGWPYEQSERIKAAGAGHGSGHAAQSASNLRLCGGADRRRQHGRYDGRHNCRTDGERACGASGGRAGQGGACGASGGRAGQGRACGPAGGRAGQGGARGPAGGRAAGGGLLSGRRRGGGSGRICSGTDYGIQGFYRFTDNT